MLVLIFCGRLTINILYNPNFIDGHVNKSIKEVYI
uniref:Uncharacterized protein n=1 Tax=Myoviridae sp. ctwwN25 TaxID=2825209 RepID=A0A8S5PPV6_9CAUD|nr:MAG TPA: hypothetical protein [Myoviridae sp. ctwwN25]